MFKILKTISILFLLTFNFKVMANEIQNIEIDGNIRIPKETIVMFSKVKIGDNINEIDLNSILKNIYDTSFFENVSVEITGKTIFINVNENPVIENINFSGLKAKKILETIKDNTVLKSRSSYSDYLLQSDKKKIINILKDFGYYFSNVEIFVTDLENNKVNLNYNIILGEKSKIKRISFTGNKIFKNNKLRSLIVSEEYNFEIYFGKSF